MKRLMKKFTNPLIFILSLIFSLSAFGFSSVDSLINNAIKEKIIPGGVLLVGQKDSVLYQKSYESTFDTLYDLASLTKIITATSIMILEEQRKLKVSDKLSKFYPQFDVVDKKDITVANLLRHNSGLPPSAKAEVGESYDEFINKTLSLPLEYKAGEKTVYSDVGFIILGDLVKRVSGLNLSEFTHKFIFKPLGMNDTHYNVLDKDQSRCAPTSLSSRCIPHDPKAHTMFPYSLGHAGVFSTVSDLSKLAQMFLHKGIFKRARILKEVSVRKMSMISEGELRGMGFDLKSPYAVAPRGEVFPEGISYGHTGFTGTTFWIDPKTESYYIFLSNRVLLGANETGKAFTELRRNMATKIGEKIYKSFNEEKTI